MSANATDYRQILQSLKKARRDNSKVQSLDNFRFRSKDPNELTVLTSYPPKGEI